ncbi:hypothetical protein [Gordonia hankookensis]|uniref:Mce-associated membrane protein n=1 Tax=Gordonia hankookensis TaxID=589403 RepID=A0ABR7W9R8_9ACTN|nr:hypothetical protein [Gordonia hankookensis]MBD1319552.1 hypothetical protein [Gordonia hankookensis]
MTRSLLNGSDGVAPSADPSEEVTDLEVAEAEVAAAEAEAAAARARANAALARARIARTQRENPDEKVADAEPDPIRSQRDATDDALDDVDPADATHVAASAMVTIAEPDVREPELTEPELTESDAVVDHDATAEPGRIRRFAAAARHRIAPLRRPTKRGIAVTVMSVITIAALVTTGLIGWHHHTTTSEHERADTFTAAADRGVAAITSLDFNNAQRDVQRILDQSTGSFYNDFKGRAKDFTSVIEQSKVTTKGKVTGSAVESVNGDDAVVLVSASSDVTNAAGAKQEPRTWRLRVTVSDADGTMKISKVDFVP